MAVRANFDLQKRKFYENTTESAENLRSKGFSPKSSEWHLSLDTLRVDFVDFLPRLNANENRTSNYELVHSGKPSAIFRRGQTFFMEITFQNRDFNANRDCLLLNFYLGPNPSTPKKTRIVLPITNQKNFKKLNQFWDVRIQKQDPGRLTLQVNIPPFAPIGCWHCVIESTFKEFKKNRLQYRACMSMYIIFNPFSSDDSTFMDNDEMRREYLMNDNGKIFLGGFKCAKGRPWIYGQFEDCVLPAACVLLEMSKLPHSEWGNPVKVVRALSSMIKAGKSGGIDSSCNGKTQGVIVPRYEDDFRGGSSPHLWTGSVQIIEEFLKGGASPVKFGHCWVIAALMTTLCRALGLASRPVTAIVAALNTQHAMTIDKYVDKFGDIIEGGPGRDQPDSLWAFHAWCDVWMRRADLPVGNCGWQACDPARSSKDNSDGLNGGCGPCSTEAIRKGDLGLQKDTDAFYGLLNSYVRYFYEADQSEWGFSPFRKFRFAVSKYILTKALNQFDDVGGEDAEDITNQYKDEDLTKEERLFIYNAFRGRCRGTVDSDFEANSLSCEQVAAPKGGDSEDVSFDFQDPVRIPLGEPFSVTLSCCNRSRAMRTVQANISCRSIFYTGNMGPHIKRITGQFSLEADNEESLTLRIDPTEYQEKLIDMSFVKLTATGFVKENGQSFVEEFDFKFDKPNLMIECSAECAISQEVPLSVSFVNPLGMTLTECFVTFEVNGSVRPTTIQIEREVGPRDMFQLSHTFTPRRDGLRHLVVAFTSKQLSDVTGVRKILIKE